MEYFSRIENIFPMTETKDNKWLAGALECLVAVQYLILKKKLDFNQEKYSLEKRESAYSKMVRSLRIYGSDLQNYNKAASCFGKYCHFFYKMGMNSYFHRLLGDNLGMLLDKRTSIIHKISCADYAIKFECFRSAAFLLFDAHEQYKNSAGALLINSANVQRSEIVLLMIQILGKRKLTPGIHTSGDGLQKVLSKFSTKPLVNRPIIQFILTNLHSLNLWNDKRYCLCLIFLMTMMINDKEKEKVWESIITFSPNLSGEEIVNQLDLPYFSYMLAVPNPRKIMRRKLKDEGSSEKKEASLFLYDPRKKIVSTNWCSLGFEEMVVFLYNPLPFSVVIDSLVIVTKNIKSASHSGKIVLKPFEQKKKVTVLLKVEKEGELEITGVVFTIKKLTYTMSSLLNGVSVLAKNNPELPCSVVAVKPVEFQGGRKPEPSKDPSLFTYS